MSSNTLQAIRAELNQDMQLLAQSLSIQCGECVIQIQSNDIELLEVLQRYFRHILLENITRVADIKVVAIESVALETDYPFKEWPREAGKSGRKDAYYDYDAVRLIRKVRTGMIFMQSEQSRIAVGPCLANPNQVVNFINSQYMNWLQQQHWLICHAAAVSYASQAYALAGFSGGGKSTLMLQLMNDDKMKYISNDRVFIRSEDNVVQIAGIAKLPRINPGTIVHNPRLHSLIPEQQRKQLLGLPRQQLWEIEEKYDVDIETVYGKGRIVDNQPLKGFIVLNWQHDSAQDCRINRVNLHQRQDLLAAIMKSPGPFYQDLNGEFLYEKAAFDVPAYLSILSGVNVYEVSGKVDFVALQDFFYQQILVNEAAQ